MATTEAATTTKDGDHRRPNLDHPIYALMIMEAIRSLDEPEGSTEASISEFIKANFSGLPSGHDRLLPYYLRKLINNGEAEFVMGPHGRYHMAQAQDGDPNSQGDATAAQKHNFEDVLMDNRNDEDNFVVPLQPQSLSPDDEVAMVNVAPEQPSQGEAKVTEINEEDEGVPFSCEGDLVMELKPLPPTISEPMPKRQGRPPKRRWKHDVIGNIVVTKAQDGEKVVLKKILPRQEHGAKKPVLMRRKTPPKRKCTEPTQLVDPSTLLINGNGVEAKVSNENQVTGLTPTPKRRGRPPKRNPEFMDNSEAVVVQNGDVKPNPSPLGTNGNVKHPMAEESNDGSKPVNKRLGRPPKRMNEGDVKPLQLVVQLVVPSSLGANGNAMLPVSKIATRKRDDGSKPVPKRRKRPPKRKSDGGAEPLQSVDDNATLVVSGKAKKRKDDRSDPVPKRLGRPPKRKNEPTDGSNDAIAQDGEAKPTKRGRKSKKSSKQESGGDRLSMNPKDNTEMQQERKEYNPVPKRLGRPRKADSTSVPKRRGRPPKAKPDTQGI